MIESIVTDYLQGNRRLVIPGLGAFLRKEGGEMVFVPFLNKDDGVLSGLVRQTYGSSAAEAEEIIGQYTDGVAQALAGQGSYFVAGLGSLRRDTNGILFLDPDGRPEDPEVKPAAPVIEAIEVVEILQEEVPEPEKPAEIERPALVGEEIAAPKTLYDRLLEQQQQEKASEPVRPAPVAPPIRETPPRPQPPASPRPHSVTPRPEPKKPAPAPRATPQPAQTGTKRADWVLILAIVIAVIAVAAMIYAYTTVGGPTFNLE